MLESAADRRPSAQSAVFWNPELLQHLLALLNLKRIMVSKSLGLALFHFMKMIFL